MRKTCLFLSERRKQTLGRIGRSDLPDKAGIRMGLLDTPWSGSKAVAFGTGGCVASMGGWDGIGSLIADGVRQHSAVGRVREVF